MERYNYEKINKLIQPVIELMKEEFPNDCEIIIDSTSAQIVFRHRYLTFLRTDLNPGSLQPKTEKELPKIDSEDYWKLAMLSVFLGGSND